MSATYVPQTSSWLRIPLILFPPSILALEAPFPPGRFFFRLRRPFVSVSHRALARELSNQRLFEILAFSSSRIRFPWIFSPRFSQMSTPSAKCFASPPVFLNLLFIFSLGRFSPRLSLTSPKPRAYLSRKSRSPAVFLFPVFSKVVGSEPSFFSFEPSPIDRSSNYRGLCPSSVISYF